MNDVEKNLHLQDVKIDCIERVLKDTNTGALDPTGNQHEVIHNVDKMCQVKAYIGTLKHAWALSEAAIWFANGVEQESLADDVEENWLSCEHQVQEKELMNKGRKEAEKVKNDIEDVQEELEEHAEEIQTADEAIREQKVQIQNRLSVVKEKMEKLKKLQERKELLESQKREHASACGTASYTKEHLTEKLEQTTGAREQCSAAVDSLSEHTTLLESERDAGQKALTKLEEMLSTSNAEQEKSLNSSEQERMDSFYNFVTSCGLRVVNFAENWIEIEISDIYDSQDVSTLLLTVHFGEGDDPVPVEDVTANCSTSFIKDLIDHLKSTHELKVFNFEVQKRFHNHVKLLKEMKLLQKRFAIDWNEDELVVRLMLGKAGQIVCNLKVENEYPTNGDASVEEIHGADPAIIFQDSLVSDSHVSGAYGY
ncbi:Hypothetical predicted protein [Paramuricea clavata]|uniref:Uncharacterized protein n=1 Tax=Paramuricea clavata TaxID=317549 RepID=A0A6S7FMX7_PARCT|nr:Hypothetical predicted protein [Paramuricea clavata]